MSKTTLMVFSPKKFGKLLGEVRPETVAAAVNVSTTTIRAWRDGIGEPIGSNAVNLARFFNVPVEALYEPGKPE